MKDKSIIVLKSLLIGIPVEMNGYTYKLFKPEEEISFPTVKAYCEDYFLAIEYKKLSSYKKKEKKETVYIKSLISLQDFIILSENLSDDEIAIIAANNVLNEKGY